MCVFYYSLLKKRIEFYSSFVDSLTFLRYFLHFYIYIFILPN